MAAGRFRGLCHEMRVCIVQFERHHLLCSLVYCCARYAGVCLCLCAGRGGWGVVGGSEEDASGLRCDPSAYMEDFMLLLYICSLQRALERAPRLLLCRLKLLLQVRGLMQ